MALARLLLVALLQCACGAKIPLSVDNVYDVFGINAFGTGAANLLDEQQLSGDPRDDPTHAGKPVNSWLPIWDGSWYPTTNPNVPGPKAAIDLGATYVLSQIFVFYNYGNYDLDWGLAATNPLAPHTQWRVNANWTWGAGWHAINLTDAKPSRYVTLALVQSPGNSLLELVFYGTRSTAQTVLRSKPTAPPPQSPFGLLLGTNAFVWSQFSNLTGAVGTVREYQDWEWTEGGSNYPGYPHNQNRFQCMDDGFCLDDVYANSSRLGLPWHQCVQGTPLWVHGYNQSQASWKPLTLQQMFTPGASIDPKSYANVGDHLWQVAARYGRQKVDDSLLKLAPNRSVWDKTPQPRLSGLNTQQYLEVMNEPNAWWKDRETYFSPEEQAAMQSAAYDGHCKTLSNIGAKQADPNIRVSLGGLAMPDVRNALDRLQTIEWWSQLHRSDSAFPADVINIHMYANDGKQGISPEAFNLADRVANFSRWRDEHLPGAELWLTEFGYDTSQQSPQRAPPIGSTPSVIVQGQWLLRSVLALAAIGGGGVQRAHQYMLPDVDSSSQGLYATSGLVTSKGEPKPAWFFYHCFTTELGKLFHLRSDCASEDNVCTATFGANPGQAVTAVAVWSPTASNRQVAQRKVAVPFPAATLATPSPSSTSCVSTPLAVVGGAVEVTVTELPIIILSK